MREARRGCDLMPASKDAWRALHRLENPAVVYAMVGRPGDAVTALDRLLTESGERTVDLLRLDPGWDPLRSDPRSPALLAKYQVKP